VDFLCILKSWMIGGLIRFFSSRNHTKIQPHGYLKYCRLANEIIYMYKIFDLQPSSVSPWSFANPYSLLFLGIHSHGRMLIWRHNRSRRKPSLSSSYGVGVGQLQVALFIFCLFQVQLNTSLWFQLCFLEEFYLFVL
jgi:hypothetical protein